MEKGPEFRMPFDKGAEQARDEAFEAASGEWRLFDQNEDAGGETTDLATGKRIDNSSYMILDGLQKRTGLPVEDRPELKKDAAAEWLRNHDPEGEDHWKEAA